MPKHILKDLDLERFKYYVICIVLYTNNMVEILYKREVIDEIIKYCDLWSETSWKNINIKISHEKSLKRKYFLF